jgi:hypothetical protein
MKIEPFIGHLSASVHRFVYITSIAVLQHQ